MFGPLLLIRWFLNFLKILNNPRKVLLTDISDGIPWLFYFCDPDLVLKPREVINLFPYISYFPFDSEDVIFILSRLSNFDEMSKVTYWSLPLISLCFLTLRRPQLFMSTARKKNSLPVNFSSQNVFRVDQQWWICGGVTTSRSFMLIS